jgi:transposase
VGMESTGVYWKPVFYHLERQVRCWLLNARHMRAVPGRKTDMNDAEWIADLIAHGLVRPSFVPPPPVRRLRDLTRRRATLHAERTREKQRLEKVLEDAGVKLSVVASDLLGKSARAMLDAMIAGQRDPHILAELALRRMRAKTGALARALPGRFDEHHAFLTAQILRHIDHIDAQVGDLDRQISTASADYTTHIDLLDSVHGIDHIAATAILAEIGADMTRFPTAAHLASWAGVCPGNNKTGGKAKPGHTRPGNRWLKATLGIAALAAIRKKNTYTNTLYRRIARRRGGNAPYKPSATACSSRSTTS